MSTRSVKSSLVTHSGGCHCGAVRFEVQAEGNPTVHACNCSMCHMLGFLHLIVPRDRFRLLRGETSLTEYRFNTGTARHLFCAVCGVKSFYVPRSHPDGFSVNVRCIDEGTLDGYDVQAFDGRNWEQHVHELTPLPEK